MDNIALMTLKNSKMATSTAYNAAKTATLPIAPGMLQLACVLYNQILTLDSKNKIDVLFKGPLKIFYSKYNIATVLCSAETLDLNKFIELHKNELIKLLELLGINEAEGIVSSKELLTNAINSHIDTLIKLIKSKETEIKRMSSIMGGKSRKKRRYRTRKL